ncbi:lysophospholipid acyltransferase family protein [Microbacterium sp. P07]|uniref:lysophospholipid acyltransferase family protein n=1 Tax=Microbacterium sp. P07 TaxID=3366952 RepID=UPI003745C735
MASARRDTSPEKSRPSVFWLLGGVVEPLTAIFAKIEIENPEKLPREGSYVLAPNHYSNFDPMVVAVAVWRIGRAPSFMAKESLFRVPVLGWALRATRMVPVSRSSSASAARDTIRGSEQLVKDGRGVVVYPEGTLTRDPDLWPMRGKTGAVRLALAGGVPLVPMAQWGVQEIMPRYGKLRLWPLRRRVRVVLGDPVDIVAHGADLTRPATLVAATDLLMDRIAELLGPLREGTPPAQRWNPSAHGQNETGRLES